jgi:hypothetical protein
VDYVHFILDSHQNINITCISSIISTSISAKDKIRAPYRVFRRWCDTFCGLQESRILGGIRQSACDKFARVACDLVACSLCNESVKALSAPARDSRCINKARAALLAAPTSTCRWPTRRGAASGHITYEPKLCWSTHTRSAVLITCRETYWLCLKATLHSFLHSWLTKRQLQLHSRTVPKGDMIVNCELRKMRKEAIVANSNTGLLFKLDYI